MFTIAIDIRMGLAALTRMEETGEAAPCMEVHMMRCVYWIPASAGMTVVLKGLRRADFIPASAGMTGKNGAIVLR